MYTHTRTHRATHTSTTNCNNTAPRTTSQAHVVSDQNQETRKTQRAGKRKSRHFQTVESLATRACVRSTPARRCDAYGKREASRTLAAIWGLFALEQHTDVSYTRLTPRHVMLQRVKQQQQQQQHRRDRDKLCGKRIVVEAGEVRAARSGGLNACKYVLRAGGP